MSERSERGAQPPGEMSDHMNAFPFAGVVGQDDAKLALQIAAVDRRIGGVLLRGEKGSAKTTLARGLPRCSVMLRSLTCRSARPRTVSSDRSTHAPHSS